LVAAARAVVAVVRGVVRHVLGGRYSLVTRVGAYMPVIFLQNANLSGF